MLEPNLDPGVPLARVMRHGRVESLHSGHLVVLDAQGSVLLSRGSPETPIWVRSAVKPVQALPLWLTDTVGAFRLSDKACAIAMASHSGQDIHVEAVQEILTRAGIDEGQLGCGTHSPYHEPTAQALVQAGHPPSVLHCNCSGKHAAMLAVCRHMGWEGSTYLSPSHPLQQRIRGLIAQLAEVDERQIAAGVDGCGAPVWRLSVLALARIYSRLVRPAGLPPAIRQGIERAREVFVHDPLLIAGEGRLDTDLMRSAPGEMLAKIGGEAVHAGGLLASGWSWAVKISDGNKRAIGPALYRALAELGHPWPPSGDWRLHTHPRRTNNRGEEIGSIEAAW